MAAMARTEKKPVEFESVINTDGQPVDQVLSDAAATFDTLIGPNLGYSGDRLAAERVKFLSELRDALLKHDGEMLN
jgi:hypothetical protein